MKSGTIYSINGDGGEIKIGNLIKTLKLIARVLRITGFGCMIIAAVGLLFIYVPLGTAEIRYMWGRTNAGREIARIDRNMTIGKIQENTVTTTTQLDEKPTWTPPDDQYSIYIPKIEALSRVIPGVSVENKEDYMAALQKGVAEAAGLSHPGEIGTTYLFAHSVGNRIDYARYNAVFYLLDKLDIGDSIEIVYGRKVYKYRVWNKEILEPNDVRYLLPQHNEEKLILQTCYPPGTTWKRLEVTAKRT